MENLKKADPDIYNAIKNEVKRQQHVLEMIPSENFVSEAVLEALGSVMTNKYSEGYPGKRYYGGQEFIDVSEQLAIDRAKELFGAEHVNVQPLSGAPANIAVYFALLEPGDTVLGMDLTHGGHLTHGHPVTHAAKLFNFVRYKTDKKTGEIDFDELEKIAKKHKPKIVLCGYTSYTRELDYERFKKIADTVGALTMADIAHIAGLIAAGLMNNPVEHFDIVTTTTHKTLRGPRGGMIMCKKEHAKKIDKSVFPGLQGGPHEHNIAAKAVAFKEALQPEYKSYCKNILTNAKVLEEEFKKYGFELCFGGTDNHMVLVDVFKTKGITGKDASSALDKAQITVNKNLIPYDSQPPLVASGIRLGSPALTSRGMKEPQMRQIARLIDAVLSNIANIKKTADVKEAVSKLTQRFPVYKNKFRNK